MDKYVYGVHNRPICINIQLHTFYITATNKPVIGKMCILYWKEEIKIWIITIYNLVYNSKSDLVFPNNIIKKYFLKSSNNFENWLKTICIKIRLFDLGHSNCSLHTKISVSIGRLRWRSVCNVCVPKAQRMRSGAPLFKNRSAKSSVSVYSYIKITFYTHLQKV